MMNRQHTHRTIKDKSTNSPCARNIGQLILILAVNVSILGVCSPSFAGAYLFSDSAVNNNITHPSGYTGSGGILTVGICIDPNTTNTTQMEVSVQNIVNTINERTVTTGNLLSGTNNNVPPNFFDFESVVLHEVGHCLGLAHVNAASESGLSAINHNFTRAAPGANSALDIAPGPDAVIGSSDDIRGDDINLHWFNISANNPFIIDMPVDSSTYSRDTAKLPAGHSFATNADRAVANLYLLPGTESIMQQGTESDEVQRTLVADDVATLKYAMSGLDEIAGNADDYILKLEYRGISDTNCDISIDFNAPNSSFAFCSVTQAFISAGHSRINNARISLNGSNNSVNWFFNDVVNSTDTAPATFVFTDQTNVALEQIITSNSITVSGINDPTAITVSGGEYSKNGTAFVGVSGAVVDGDTVVVRHTSSASFLTVTNTTLTIGGISDTFSSTTISGDTAPDTFTFTDQADVPIDTNIVSNSITVSGLTASASAAISVSGGEYSINGSAFTAVAGFVNNGNTVLVQHTSSTSLTTQTNTTLTIGGVSDVFTSITLGTDTIPDQFTFIDKFDVPLVTAIVSNPISIAGINGLASITISGGEYSVNNGTFTANKSVVNNDDRVVLRHISHENIATATATILTVGGISAVFSSTTLSIDRTPDNFTFAEKLNVPLNSLITSNEITVFGIVGDVTIRVNNGQFSINGDAITRTTRTVNNGDTVVVQHTSSANSSAKTTTRLSIGNVDREFSSTTLTDSSGGGGAVNPIFWLMLMFTYLLRTPIRIRRRKTV